MNKYLVISMHKLFNATVIEQLATEDDAKLLIGIMSRKNPDRTYKIAIIQD